MSDRVERSGPFQRFYSRLTKPKEQQSLEDKRAQNLSALHKQLSKTMDAQQAWGVVQTVAHITREVAESRGRGDPDANLAVRSEKNWIGKMIETENSRPKQERSREKQQHGLER